MFGQHHHFRECVEHGGLGSLSFITTVFSSGVSTDAMDASRAAKTDPVLPFLARSKVDFASFDVKGFAVMPFGMGQFERIGQLVGADLERFCQIPHDIFKLVVIDHQRFKIGDKPCEAARCGQWIEIALKPPGPTSNPPEIVPAAMAGAA